MIKKSIVGVGLIVAAGLWVGEAVQAALVAEWDMTDEPGNQVFTPGMGGTNVTAQDVTRGSGLTANSGADSLNSRGWSGEIADYVSFGFVVDPGYQVDLDEFFIGTRSSNTGPGSLGLYYSGDGFASVLYTFSQSGTAFLDSLIDLSALVDLTDAVEFRIVQIGTTAADGSATTGSAGTFRVTDYAGGGADSSITITGFIERMSAVPEPTALALLAVGLPGIALVRRRKGPATG